MAAESAGDWAVMWVVSMEVMMAAKKVILKVASSDVPSEWTEACRWVDQRAETLGRLGAAELAVLWVSRMVGCLAVTRVTTTVASRALLKVAMMVVAMAFRLVE